MAEPEPMEIEDGREEEDEIVEVIPIFVAQSLKKQLHVFQYPLRPTSRQIPPERIQQMRMKFQHKTVEMEVAEDVKGDHFDVDHEYGKRKSAKLRSSYVEPATNYAIGVLDTVPSLEGKDQKQFHMTPLEGIIPMRPSFSHVDEADESQEVKVKDEGVDTTPKPLQVQMKKREHEKAVANRKASHSFLKQKEEEEPWTELTLHREQTVLAGDAFQKLRSAEMNALQHDVKASEYLDKIQASGAKQEAESEEQNVFSAHSLKRLPLEEQLKRYLVNGIIFSLQDLKSILPTCDEKQLLGALSKQAILVQGNWVAKSDLLPLSVPEMDVRDLLLASFAHSREIAKSEFLKAFPKAAAIHHTSLQRLFESLGNLDPVKRVWELKLPADDSFQQSFASVVAEEKSKLEAITARIERGEARVQAKKTNTPADGEPTSKPPTSKSSIPAVQPLSASESASLLARRRATAIFQLQSPKLQLAQLLLETLRGVGVCSPQLLQQMLAERRAESNTNNLLSGITGEVLAQTVGEMCETIHGLYVLKEMGNPQTDKFRTAVISFFKSKKSTKKTEISQFVKEQVGEPIPKNLYKGLMQEFANNRGAVWTLKDGSGS